MNIKNILYVFFCSMLPIIELRGSVIIGAGLGLNPMVNYAVSVIGNLIPVPFILLFIRQILRWMRNVKGLSKVAIFIENKAHKHSDKVLKYARLGLFLFVAIPVPGTGAWTGALIAALLDMRMKYSMLSIIAGVLCAGVIMILASYGVISCLSIFA